LILWITGSGLVWLWMRRVREEKRREREIEEQRFKKKGKETYY
jgi:hypothetical protein